MAIHAPRLNDTARGSTSSAEQASAQARCFAVAGASARPTAHTSPNDTTVAIPMTSPAPKVPTARMFSPE